MSFDNQELDVCGRPLLQIWSQIYRCAVNVLDTVLQNMIILKVLHIQLRRSVYHSVLNKALFKSVKTKPVLVV